MKNRRQSGKATGSLLLLLILAAGAGGWNYHRNWTIEKQQERVRPYARYKTEDLKALRAAYSADMVSAEARLNSAKHQRGRVSKNQGSIAQNVDQFAATTRTSSNIRNAASELAAQQTQASELDKELAYRAEFGSGMQLHLKRLTSF